MQWMRWVDMYLWIEEREEYIVYFMFMYVGTYVYGVCLSQYQQTSLHFASEKGYKGTVQLLLEKGANPNRPDWVRFV